MRVQESNTIWIDMYVPLVNILFAHSKSFRLRMAAYSHVLVDEVQACFSKLCDCVPCAASLVYRNN